MNSFKSSRGQRRTKPTAIGKLLSCAALALAATVGFLPTATGAGASTRAHRLHGFPLNVTVMQPFSGPDAAFGQVHVASCHVAAEAINQAGGVLGHRINCNQANTKNDAADAITVLDKVLASTPHLIAFIGPGTLAPALAPIIGKARIVMLSNTTDPRFDHNKDPYFFRLLPSDSLAGVSLAYWAVHHGYKHVVAVWNTTTSSQTNVPSFKATYKLLGGHLAGNFNLAPTLTNYRTEALAILNDKPDAIVMDSGPGTGATLFSNLKQLGKIPQVIVDSSGEVPTFITAVAKAIGMPALDKFISIGQTTPSTKTAGFKAWDRALKALHKSSTLKYADFPYAIYGYTGLVIEALALTANKTVSPAGHKVLADIQAMMTPGRGKVTVHTYPQGLAALKRGVSIDKIYYLGAYGPIDMNKYHNGSATFQAVHDGATPTSALVPVGKPITAATMSKLLARTGL